MNGLSSNNMSGNECNYGNGSAGFTGSTGPAPFLLAPVGKDYIWGGNKLHTDFNLERLDKIQPLAEAWVCSTHQDGISRVNSSVLAADTANTANTANTAQLDLKTVLTTHPEYLGTHATAIVNHSNLPLGELPILVKLIDAKQDLSVQVHPNDTYAAKNEGGSLGKTEMWYVIDAEPNASLVYGLTREVTAKEFREAIENGSLEKCLNRVPVRRGDVFFIRAGVVHAIGAGCLIAEVQESSNLTYRLYDYNRRDPKTGKKRELHVEKGLAVANLCPYPVRQPMRTLRYRRGMASELLARCRYFQVERMLINTRITQEKGESSTVELKVGSNSFHVLVCLDGEISLASSVLKKNNGSNINIDMKKGSCAFIPADVEVGLLGHGELLDISC